MKKNDKKIQIKILKIILIIIWMITVFYFSNQQGEKSSNTSRSFTIEVIETITGKSIDENEPFMGIIESIIRKLAHYTIYAIGGFLIMNYSYSIDKNKKKKILYSIGFGGAYAITDELHQLFVPGRSGKVLDVGIDTIGVITGVIMYIVIRKFIEKIINKHKS